MSEPTRVLIENFPDPTPWYVEWAPILIALAAVIVSVVSLCRARRANIDSSRPFVWANEFGYLNQQQQVTPRHDMLMMKVLNAPARILSSQFVYRKESPHTTNVLLDHTDRDFVRYPDSNIQWTFTFNAFNQELMSLSNGEFIEREVKIKYAPLSGGESYNYFSHAKFDIANQQWNLIDERAS